MRAKNLNHMFVLHQRMSLSKMGGAQLTLKGMQSKIWYSGKNTTKLILQILLFFTIGVQRSGEGMPHNNVFNTIDEIAYSKDYQDNSSPE